MCPNHVEVLVGHCRVCNLRICEDSYGYTDAEGNIFCSVKCTHKFYGVKEVECFGEYV